MENVVEFAVINEQKPAATDPAYFNTLNGIDLSAYVKQKNGLDYLPWSIAYQEMLKYDPNATFKILTQYPDDKRNERFWFDDGKSAWVQTEVTIGGVTKRSFPFPIMDFKNKAMAADAVTTTDANKSVMRCLVKNIALFGLGLYIYQGEDLPEDVKNALALKDEVVELAKAKFKLGGAAKEKAENLMKDAQRQAFPDMDEELITGKISDIENEDILKNLKMKLNAIRVKATKKSEDK